MRKTVLPITFAIICSCAAASAPSQPTWKHIELAYRAVNVTATGVELWECGVDETVNGSIDGGATWLNKHKTEGGEVLLNIAFLDSRIGFASGTGGLLLATTDGGDSWKAHKLSNTVKAMSFSDAANGIVVTSAAFKSTQGALLDQVNGDAWVNATVQVTRDGGEHWQEVTALRNDSAFQPYSEVHSVAALDSVHFLVSLRQPEGEYIYAVTRDGGKTWKPVHLDDTYAATVFVHDGEYWAFGLEMLDPKGRRYSAPVSLHSKDGIVWKHGIRGPNEFSDCTAQGCSLWDGVLESFYGEKPGFWLVPQDGSLTSKWAVAGHTVCTVGDELKCGPATFSNETPHRPEADGVITISLSNGGFFDDCLVCGLPSFEPNPAMTGHATAKVHVSVARDGTVSSVSVSGVPANISEAITQRAKGWLFEPAHKNGTTVETEKDTPIVVLCQGMPQLNIPVSCSFFSPESLRRPQR